MSGTNLRKREILLAVAIGGLGAAGAALALELRHDEARYNEAHVVVRTDVSGPGEIAYDLSEFDDITTIGPQNVVVTYGEEFSVRSEGPAQVLELFEAEVDGGHLSIEPRRGYDTDLWNRLAPATFYITVPRLENVALLGSGDVHIDRIEGEDFSGTVAGSGTLTIEAMDVEEADLSIAGSGDIVAAGRTRETSASIGGSGAIRAGELRSETASVRIAGSGDTSLWVADDARVSIIGSGDVEITGTDNCSISRVGSGNVRCSPGPAADE